MSPTEPRLTLDAVVITAELDRRTSRSPNYEAESRGLATLIDAMAGASGNDGADHMLQRLAETALVLCQAHSAGVTLLEQDDGREIVRLRAAAGPWRGFLSGAMPRDASPSGTVLDRNAPILMCHAERHFPAPDDMPPLVELLLVPFGSNGKPVGTVWIAAHDDTQQFDNEDRRLMTRLSRFAAGVYRLLAAQDLVAQLADARLLQAISAELIVQDDVKTLYEKLLDGAIQIMGSDFASIQMLSPNGDELKLLANRGFTPEAAAFWETVRLDSHSTCGEALRAGSRSIVRDVEHSDVVAGDDLRTYRQTGIRAVQSTPLLSRTGKLVGMMSTHWRQPHQPSPRDLTLFDILARQAADLVERRHVEEALRTADQRKDAFIAILGHELRNPLAPIRNAVQLLRAAGAMAPELEWARDVIDRQVQHMSRLIDDLLDIARITHDRMELQIQPVELAMVVHAAVEICRPLVEERRHTMVVLLPAEPIVVDADAMRLAQVFGNLINNAAKYSEPGGRIMIEARRESNEVMVSVRDEGIGIERDMLPRIFDQFRQIGTKGAGGGLGIGLALVKRLVDLHGGRVTATSKGRGAGSEFEVRLPVVAEQTAAIPAAAVEAPLARAPTALRILIVDDNEDSAVSLGTVLGTIGYDIHTAHDGVRGLDAATALRPDVIILDIGLPEMDGYEVARRIRAEPWGQPVTLIALTGWGQAEDRRRTAAAGFDKHLVKPVDPAALAQLLASITT